MSDVLYDCYHKDVLEVIPVDQSEAKRLSGEGVLQLPSLNGSGGLI